MTRFFKKSQKPYFGATLILFHPNLGKKHFPGKGTQLVFKYSNNLFLWKKSEKTNQPILRKTPKLTDAQTDNGDFIGRRSSY